MAGIYLNLSNLPLKVSYKNSMLEMLCITKSILPIELRRLIFQIMLTFMYSTFEEEDTELDIPRTFREEMSQLWNTLSPFGEPLGGCHLKQIMIDTNASIEFLRRIWNLADIEKTGNLDKDEFILAMHLAHRAAQGNPPPSSLGESLIPPSKRINKNAT